MQTTAELQPLPSRQSCLQFIAKAKPCLIIALPGAGLSTILRALPHVAYLDLARTSLTPEGFAQEMAAYAKDTPPAQRINNELEKIKPNQQQLITDAFACLGTLKGKIIIEHYEHLLDFSNYPQLRHAKDIIEQELAKLDVICTSTRIARFSKESKDRTKAIITAHYLGLDEKETEDICRKYGLQRAQAKEVYTFAKGNAFLTIQLATRIAELKDTKDAIATELLWQQSQTYHFFSTFLDDRLNEARGATILRTIIKALADEKRGLRLSDLARKIYRSAPVTKSLIERLIEVDLISKKDNTFFIPEPLRSWLAIYFMQADTTQQPTKKQMEVLHE